MLIFPEHPIVKLCILIDNCSAQGSLKTLPPLSQTTVKDLLPNTSSIIQPCDAGIIAALETNYRFFQIERASDLSETNVKNIYSVDILSVILAYKKMMKDMDIAVIRNCWRPSQILEALQAPFVAPAVYLHEEHE